MKKLYPALLLFLFVPSFLLAQNQLHHPAKIYKAKDGKLYINKSLGLYLRIATSPNADADSYLLESEDSKAYSNPMYLDTEGYNTVRTPSKVDTATKEIVYPLQDIIFELYADSKAPSTKINFDKQISYKKEDVYYYGEKLSLSFSSYDATSGVEGTYISIDGAPYKKYQEEIELNEEKRYHIQYYSVDHVGNIEDVNEIKIHIDISKPTTKLEVVKDEYESILSPRSELNIIAVDNGSGIHTIYYSLDEGALKKYKGALKISGLSEGEHSILYYAEDNVSNKEEEQVFSFYLDKTPPMVVDELLGNTFIANGKEYASGRSRIKLTAMDNKAGVKEIRYSINEGEFLPYNQPFYLNKAGSLNIKAFVTDNVNNQTIKTIMANKANLSYVDLSGPKPGYRLEGPSFISHDTAFIRKNTKILLSAKDEESGLKKIEYNIDNKPIEEYQDPLGIEEDGLHQLNYTAYDNVDNSNTKSLILFVDEEGPEIFHRFSISSEKYKTQNGKKIPVYPSHVVLFLSATDEHVGYDKMHYTIEGEPTKRYTTLIDGFKEGKLYSMDVEASDKLGNKSAISIDFFIE